MNGEPTIGAELDGARAAKLGPERVEAAEGEPEAAEPLPDPEPTAAPPLLPRGEFHNDGDVAARDSVKNGGKVVNARGDAHIAEVAYYVSVSDFATADPESGTTRKRASLRDHASVAERAKTAVWPPGLAARYRDLEADRILILTCPTLRRNGVRCGQNTAAQLLLSRLIDDAKVSLSDRLVHKLFIDQKERLLQVLNAEVTSTTYYADLVDVEESQLDQTLEDLGDIVVKLREAESYLILSFPLDYQERLERAVPGRVQELLRPAGAEVFRKHLAERLPETEITALLADPRIAEALTDCWPVDAVNLARQALRFRDHRADIAEVVTDLCNVGRDWSPRLKDELDVAVDPLKRCLLLAAAVLQGAEPGVVVDVAHELIRVTRFDLPRAHPLAERSAVVQLAALGEQTPFDPERVEFAEPGFADAVLPFVWRGYRPLRRSLKRWLTTLPDRAEWYSTADLNRLADAVVRLGAEVDASIATDIAGQWAAPSKPRPDDTASHRQRRRSVDHTRRSLAVRVLTECAVNDRIGFKVRNQLWNWAYHRKDPYLLAVVAQVCGTGFGVEFPRNALTRLRHISANEDPMVQREVVTAIRNIADGTDLPSLHQYLLPWLNKDSPGSLSVLAEAYTSVVDDLEPLGRGTGSPRVLTTATRSFWSRCYDMIPPAAVATMVDAWLRLAVRSEPRFGDAIVRLLTESVEDSLRRAGVLLYALRPDRAPVEFPPTRQDQLIAQICSKLDELEAVR